MIGRGCVSQLLEQVKMIMRSRTSCPCFVTVRGPQIGLDIIEHDNSVEAKQMYCYKYSSKSTGKNVRKQSSCALPFG